MSFWGLPDPSTGTLDDCPLADLLAHEFGHWVALQESGIQPDGLYVYGIRHEPGSPVVTKGGGTPFATSFPVRWDFAVVHAAGAVGEELYRVGSAAFECSTAVQQLLTDESCRHDLDELAEVLRRLKGREATSGARFAAEIGQAVLGARNLLVPRLSNLRDEVDALVRSADAGKLSILEVPWSAGVAARLSGRDRSWYEVDVES